MKYWTIFLAALFFSSARADEAAVRKQMAGLWTGFAVEGKGENPDRGPVKLELTIDERSIHGIEHKGEGKIDHGQGVYTLDLTRNPTWLDSTKTNERGRAESYLGILTIEGDTLKWCVTRQKIRPAQFETKERAFLVILKRRQASAP